MEYKSSGENIHRSPENILVQQNANTEQKQNLKRRSVKSQVNPFSFC